MNYLNELYNLKNKIAIITGGGGVIAGKMAEGLLQCGVKVILLTRRDASDRIKELSEFGEVSGLLCDVLIEKELIDAKEEILSKYGRIDILINCAGGNMPGATIAVEDSIFDMNMDDFNKVTQLNLNGSVLPSLVFGKIMAEQSSGSIINLSSMAVDRVITRVVGYSASKAAITNFTRWMAVEMAKKYGDGIRVNAISPGFFIGKQNKSLLTKEDGSYTDRGNDIIKNTPFGRFGDVEELIGATLFLCGGASKFVTGTVLAVDGGFNAFSGV